MAVSDILSRCNILPGGFIILSEYQENGILELEDWYNNWYRCSQQKELIDSDYLHSDCYDDDEYDCVDEYVHDCDDYDEYDKKTNQYEEKSQIDGYDDNENGINDGTINIQDENENNSQDIIDNINNNNNYNNEFNNIIDILLFGDGDNKNNDNIDDDEETSDNDGEFTDINDSETSVDSSEFEDNNDIGMTNLFIPGNDNYMYNMERNINNLERDKIYKLSQQGTKSRKPLNVLINSIIQYNYDIMDDEIYTFLYDKYSNNDK